VSEQSTGAYSPGYSSSDDPSRAQQVAGQTKAAAGQAVGEVKDTAVQQAQRVGAETRSQARNVAGNVRDRVSEQARTQNGKLVGSIRQTADHLDEMRAQHSDTPAAAVVARVADGGRQVADYLDRNGPEGVLQEVQDFARRRPGAFLATALVAGFVVGRLGKGVAKADSDAGSSKPGDDTFASTGAGQSTGSGYPPSPTYGTASAGYADPVLETPPVVVEQPTTATEYISSGTGRPDAAEGYPLGEPERRP
jgi:hypothetical protein